MSSLIEIKYNPYIPRLNILINGNSPSDYSRLVQYTNEDIHNWCYEILDVIYSEIQDTYSIIFESTFADFELFKFYADRNKNCLGIKNRKFVVNEPLNKRMGKLNRLIKSENITLFKTTNINCGFILTGSAVKYSKDIYDIDINNKFCKVNIQQKNEGNDINFVICDNINEINTNNHQNLFDYGICIGKCNKLIFANSNIEIYETDEKSLFSTIFNCFLSSVLLIAFRNAVSSLRDNLKISNELKLMSSIDPIIKCDINLPIEVGKSSPILLSLEPHIGNIPKLNYVIRDEKIANCNGLCVIGKSAGKTVLDIYEIGAKFPFISKDINVIKRNRITKLILSEREIIIGENQKKFISCDFAPSDADNVNAIKFSSSDENIAVVKNGTIFAKKQGSCRIICCAENVSAQCICIVKPFLEDFLIEYNEIVLDSMEEIELKVKCIPENSIDSKLIFESSDKNIVNIVGNKLIGKSKGSAEITIHNVTDSVRKVISVKVVKNKNGLFYKLFN